MLHPKNKQVLYYTPIYPQWPPLYNGHFPLSTHGGCREVQLYKLSN